MAFRNFSDEALASIKQHYYNCIFSNLYDPDWLQYGLNDYFDGCHGGGFDPVESKRKRQEIYDAAVVELEAVFRSVQDYDSQTGPGLASATGQLDAFRQVVRSLRDIIDPYPESGSCALTLPAAELAQRLGANLEALADIPMRRFRTLDEDGNPVYDWDEIERVGQLPADDITPLEYYALAYLYSQMSEEDMERFIQRLAEPGGGYGILPGDPERPTWRFDPAKLEELSKYLVLSYVAQDLDIDADTLTRLAILSALPGLGRWQGSGEWGSGITGDPDAAYPPIDITLSPDGSVIIDYTYVHTREMHSNWSPSDSVSRSGSTTIQVPDSKSLETQGKWGEIVKAKLDASDDFDSTTLGSIAVAVAGLGLTVIKLPDPYSKVGGVALFVIGSGLLLADFFDRQLMVGEISADQDKGIQLGEVGGFFGCGAVVTTTTEAGNSSKVYLLPGISTYDVIDRVNEALASDPDVSSIVGTLGYPLTFSAIEGNPVESQRFLNDFKSQYPEEYSAIVGS